METTAEIMNRPFFRYADGFGSFSLFDEIGHFAMNSCFCLLRVCCYICLFFWVWHSTVVVDHEIGIAMRAQCHPQRPYEIDPAPHNTAIHIWLLTDRIAAMSEWRFANLEGGVDSGDGMFRVLDFVNDII